MDGAPDLIIVQLAGCSRWRVNVEAAYMGRLSELQELAYVDLAPGDVLYLPKAWVGGVCSAEDFSVCAILRVFPKTQADLFRALIEAVTEQDAGFRRTVSQDLGRMARSYAEALQALELYGKSAELLRKAWEKLRLRLADEHRPLPGGHFAAVRVAAQFDTNDQVRQRSGISMAVSQTPTDVYVYVAGLGGICAQESEPGGLLFPPDALGLVSAIANSQGTFRISDLPDEYSERARLATVRRLIQEGALEVVVSSSREYGASGTCL
ncbi:JmjC domain-containing protein [Pseudomonas aeruginosa]|uniref:JmjC domain-containing protein n=1 Tax=Pseudomonas aeruginosa TaxID=287 RepID=UPI0013C522EF|nr:cupin domain-containing protein [Pseudomonas aeruginosa]